MNKAIRAGFLASALALGAAPLTTLLAAAPAYADADVDFTYFHDQLEDYGDWFYSDRWGEVWAPADVPDDWRPFTYGHWVDTEEYGWLWVSDDSFGDITAHYGRWVDDPDDGWLWIPGYVWSPGWVIWHRSGDYVGWMPMPPDERFLEGTDVGAVSGVGIAIGAFSLTFSGHSDDDYGYRRWYGPDYSDEMYQEQWHFVPLRHFDDPDYRRYEPPRQEYRTIINKSVSITNYTVVNNYIVNRSVSPEALRRAGAPPVKPMRAAQFFRRPPLVMSVVRGRQMQDRMRTEAPRGTGVAHSAPAPTEAQVRTLSARPLRAHPGAAPGARPSHLLLRSEAAPLARPNGSKPVPLTPAAIAKARAAAHAAQPAQPAPFGTMPRPPAPGAYNPPASTPQPFVEHRNGRAAAPGNPAALPPQPKPEPSPLQKPARPAERMPLRPAQPVPARPAERMPTRPVEPAPARPAERMPARPAERAVEPAPFHPPAPHEAAPPAPKQEGKPAQEEQKPKREHQPHR